jgi:hypothetical protein
MCGTPFTLSPGVWILIGVVISATFAIAFCVVLYSSRILGIGLFVSLSECLAFFSKLFQRKKNTTVQGQVDQNVP